MVEGTSKLRQLVEQKLDGVESEQRWSNKDEHCRTKDWMGSNNTRKNVDTINKTEPEMVQ